MPYDTIKSASHLGPGLYDLTKYDEFSQQNVNRRAQGANNWEKAFVTEKMAKIPHLLYIEEHRAKQAQVSKTLYNLRAMNEAPAL